MPFFLTCQPIAWRKRSGHLIVSMHDVPRWCLRCVGVEESASTCDLVTSARLERYDAKLTLRGRLMTS
jgi:hypothetical protein